MTKYFLKKLILTFITVLLTDIALPCSMYKVTANGKTMVGNNEDSWGRDPRIWFVKGTEGKYGVVCVGYARKHPKPDGAMNEHGLAFDAFSMYRKGNLGERDPNKKDFAYAHILTIMQQCKTIDEVHAFLSKLNLHILDGSPIFNGGMFLFVDKSGKYLVVEANKMTLGNDDKFALANFSIADTKDLSTITMERYCKGVAFMNNKPVDTSLAYCTALSDTMSVNRAKVNDGTLYTNIYDLDAGLIHLYFYHDFSKRITFNLQEELARGDHAYTFAELFPGNQNFQKFTDYKTPQNSKPIFAFIVVCGFLFFFSFAFYLVGFFKSAYAEYSYLQLGLSALSLLLCIYMYVLLRNEAIFYMPSPYRDNHSIIIGMSSYLPFVLLATVIPLVAVMVKILRQKKWSGFAKYLLVTNNFVYVALIGLFVYWQLFNIIK